jgi:16S rRNA (guanine966-N2)-methyltransferase
VKVIAGSAKGRNLKFPDLPKGKRLKPLTGQAKEALFNILVAKNGGARFLDLFAGTGSVGIEALSRGAELAFFVEMDRRAVETIRENLDMCGFTDRSEVYCLEAEKAVKVLDRENAKFDIVFIGAPYGSPVLGKVLQVISETKILAGNAVVVAEHSIRDKIEENYTKLSKFRDARYGDTVLSFYKITETCE